MRGTAYLLAGVIRSHLVLSFDASLVSPAQCMKQIYHSFMVFGQQAASSMVLALAIDRFLAVFLYSRYRNFGARYAILLVTTVYSVCLFLDVWLLLDIFLLAGSRTTVSRMCKLEKITSDPFNIAWSGCRLLPGLVTPFLYAYTFLLLKFTSARLGMQEQDKKRQYKLTKNIVVIVLNNFLFMTVPFGYSFGAAVMNANESVLYDHINALSISMSLFGAASNMFIYSLKYPKFRLILLRQFFVLKLTGGGENVMPNNMMMTTNHG